MSGGGEGVRGGWGGVRRRRRGAVDDAAGFQLGEHLSEESWFGVDPEHVEAEAVDDEEAAVPELVFGVFDEEGLEGVGDLVAHVGVGEVEAGEHDGLEVLRAADALAVHQLADQHVDEHHVGWVDEGHVLESQNRRVRRY